jgi:hypothetical protein
VERTNVFVTVNYNVCKSGIALYCLYLNVIKRDSNKCANKPNRPNYKPSFSSRVPPQHVTVLHKFQFVPHRKQCVSVSV